MLITSMGEILYDNERLWPFMRSGVNLPPWKSKEEGSGGGYAQSGLGLFSLQLMCIDFPKVLKEGLNTVIAEAQEELQKLKFMDPDSVHKERYLKAVILTHQAVIGYARRFANLAVEMATKEKDPVRKKELERMAEACRWVPTNPARTFYEAIQSFWFLFLMINPSPTAVPGRFDQYMYPFYKKDMEMGRLTREEALELLECMRVKDMQINRTSGANLRKKNAGMAKWHNWTIGGLTADGKDGTNELTYLVLEAAKDTQLPHHTITLRVHENTPEELLVKALEVVKTGLGMPTFIGDKSYVGFFQRNGVPLETAREYVMSGCLDANIPGYSRTVAIGMFVVPQGQDCNGPTGVMKSAMMIDQEPYQATLLNMKFHPTALKSTADLKKLAALMKTYFNQGGKHVQFNVVDRATLVAAQEKPNENRDLVVRVAGYSAYFVQLGKAMQDEVISRTEHSLS